MKRKDCNTQSPSPAERLPSLGRSRRALQTQQSVLKQLRERLEVLHARAALKQQQSDLTNDTQFNPTSEVKFSEGDMVMVRVFVKQGAFTPRWHGPYEVKAICNSCVATTVKGKLRWYHMSQCKSFKSTKIQ